MEAPPCAVPLAPAAFVPPGVLGPVLHTWQVRPVRRRLVQAALALLAVLAVALLLAWRAGADHDAVLVLAGAALALGLVAIPLALIRRAPPLRLELRPAGLAFTGPHAGLLPWAQITSFRIDPGGLDPRRQRVHPWRCVVATPSWRLELGERHLPGRTIASIIDEQTRPLVWRRLQTVLARGGELGLGDLIVSADGLAAGLTRIPWRALATVDLAGRELCLTSHDPRVSPIRVLRGRVDFLSLVEHLAAVSVGYRFGAVPQLQLPDLPPAGMPVARRVVSPSYATGSPNPR